MNENVKDIIVEVLDLDEGKITELQDDTNLIDLGLDSLSAIEVVVRLENQFDIEIEDDDLLVDNMATIGLIKKLLVRYKNK